MDYYRRRPDAHDVMAEVFDPQKMDSYLRDRNLKPGDYIVMGHDGKKFRMNPNAFHYVFELCSNYHRSG